MLRTIQIRVIKSRVPDSILEDLSTNPFWCFTHVKIQQLKLYSSAYKTPPCKTVLNSKQKQQQYAQCIMYSNITLSVFSKEEGVTLLWKNAP